MNRLQIWIKRLKTDYDYKTVTGATFSLAITMVFAVYNGFLGIFYSSLWHGTICVYYIVLTVMRRLIVGYLRNTRKKSRSKVYISASVMLLILNISLIVPIYVMVVLQKPVNMTLIPSLSMATYTTYKITMASVNLKRRHRSEDNLVRLLRTINFIDALVSIITLQNTLIMVNSEKNMTDLLPLTAITSGTIWTFILLLSVSALANGMRNNRKNNPPSRH